MNIKNIQNSLSTQKIGDIGVNPKEKIKEFLKNVLNF